MKIIYRYHIISSISNELSFVKYYFIIVHNKTILNKINMQTVFDELWYIVEYFIVDFFPSSLCFIGENPRREYYLYIMCEQYRTKVRALFYSFTSHTHQHCSICNNKSDVPESPRFPMIFSLYDSSISYTYSFVFAVQSMILTPSQNAKSIK